MKLFKILLMSLCAATLVNCASKSVNAQTATPKQSQAAPVQAAPAQAAPARKLANWEIRQKIEFTPEEKSKISQIEKLFTSQQNEIKNNTALSAEEQKAQILKLWIQKEKDIFEAMTPEHQAQYNAIKKAQQ